MSLLFCQVINPILKHMNTQTKESQDRMTPEDALELLRQGNQRFVERNPVERDLISQVHETSGGQFPFAIILSCIDSRVSSELIFDQGIGDIFNTRIAGNIINKDVLGSVEYACKVAGSKLVLVLGHTSNLSLYERLIAAFKFPPSLLIELI